MAGATVVTSENLAEFNAQALGLSEPSDASNDAADVESTKPEGEEKTVEQTEQPRIKGRFSKLTEQVDQAKTEAETKAAEAAEKEAEAAKVTDELKTEREKREAAERDRDALKAKYEPPKSDELGPEPQLEQFNDVNEFKQALKDWTREATLKEENARQEQERVSKSWTDRLDTFRKATADFDTVVGATKAQVPSHIRDEILKSDVGPQVLYFLAQNPDEAAKYASLSVGAGLKALGRLEGRFDAPKETTKVAEVVRAAPEISKAPAPITPLRGTSAPENLVDSNGEFHGTYEQYKAARRAGKI